MKVTISKKFDFDAAHWLPNVEDNHKCRRMHGHTYWVELLFSGEPDARGFVIDYAEIAEAWRPINAVLDHRVLNEIDGLSNPTTEMLAPWIAGFLLFNGPPAVSERLSGVRVYESSTTWCEVLLHEEWTAQGVKEREELRRGHALTRGAQMELERLKAQFRAEAAP